MNHISCMINQNDSGKHQGELILLFTLEFAGTDKTAGSDPSCLPPLSSGVERCTRDSRTSTRNLENYTVPEINLGSTVPTVFICTRRMSDRGLRLRDCGSPGISVVGGQLRKSAGRSRSPEGLGRNKAEESRTMVD